VLNDEIFPSESCGHEQLISEVTAKQFHQWVGSRDYEVERRIGAAAGDTLN
jgi:hypothetical protein